MLTFLMFEGTSLDADCGRPRSALVALTRADVVFRGRGGRLKTVPDLAYEHIVPRGTPSPWTGGIITLVVAEVWKGSVGRGFVLHIVSSTPDDQFTDFERGVEYVVFAKRNPASQSARFGLSQTTYGAEGCGGTTTVSTAASYLAELGVGRKPIGWRR